MLSYEKKGKGAETLVLLHGWPGDSTKWQALRELLKDRCVMYMIDFPGWGSTPLSRAYTLADYARDVRDFIAEQKIENPIIVGHSFGGRVAIKLLSENPLLAKKLILIASAGVKSKNWRIRLMHFLKPFVPKPIRRLAGNFFNSSDYQETAGVKRETFANIISEDLVPLLGRITAPTLLVWGDRDNTTPLSDGKIMESKIPGAKMVIVKDGDHGIPYRRSEEVAQAITAFL